MANQDEDDYQEEKRELSVLMENKSFRSFIWNQVLEPCKFFYQHSVRDHAHNAEAITRHDIAVNIVENIKTAHLEAYFAMERENRIDEEENENKDERED